MKFNNRENQCHIVSDEENQRLVWESRSVAVNFLVIAVEKGVGAVEDRVKVLCSKRGPNAADYNGLFNLVAGYMDWDESGSETAIRETWEECGLDINKVLREKETFFSNMDQPWHVKTDPAQNRQNISLRYGLCFLTTKDTLPVLTDIHNEVEGECLDPQWMPLSEVKKHEWAFDHDKTIFEYLKFHNLKTESI